MQAARETTSREAGEGATGVPRGFPNRRALCNVFQERSHEEPLPSLLLAMIVDTFKTAPREHLACGHRTCASRFA
jgi:hypothetical protein